MFCMRSAEGLQLHCAILYFIMKISLNLDLDLVKMVKLDYFLNQSDVSVVPTNYKDIQRFLKTPNSS